jgi:hypothetical protein
MSHTPAPWHIATVDEVGYSIHGQPIELTGIKAGIHTRIGTVSHVFEGVAPNAGWQPIPEEMNLANARLIAAAPDLLAALKLAFQALDAIGDEMTVGERYTNAGQYLIDSLNPARDAIKKAEGQS